MSQQINLFRPIFRKQQRKFSAAAMAQAGAAIAGGVLIIYALLAWHVGSLRNEMRATEASLTTATQRLQTVSQKLGAAATQPAIDREIATLEQQIAAHARVQEILSRGLFTNTAGYSDYFLALARQHVPGIWITGVDITGAGESVMLAGRAADPAQVPRYMQRLGDESALAGKEFQVFLMARPVPKDPSHAAAPFVEFTVKTEPAKEAGKS